MPYLFHDTCVIPTPSPIPPENRMMDMQLYKHYLPATYLANGNRRQMLQTLSNKNMTTFVYEIFNFGCAWEHNFFRILPTFEKLNRVQR